ncbi:MAG: class I SAM-dependent methyltransferase [Desulfobacteraceae bacterium]|nr:class I SAM-dependent methyltransferase [Desulfobacteraceae bacterium]
MKDALTFYKIDKSPSQMIALEWGCGGGANLRFLCNMFQKVYGVDISESNLNEAEKQMISFSYDNFVPILIDVHNSDRSINLINPDIMKMETIDFVISTAVFQHFPSKEYGKRVLDTMRVLMHKGGIGLIQTRYFDADARLISKDRNYKKNVVTFTSFDTKEFKNMLIEAGFECRYSAKDIDKDKASYEYFTIEAV